jgi:hypothetical protein
MCRGIKSDTPRTVQRVIEREAGVETDSNYLKDEPTAQINAPNFLLTVGEAWVYGIESGGEEEEGG